MTHDPDSGPPPATPAAQAAGGACRVTVDVAVVGGGPTGMLAALAAADAGLTVALVAPPPAGDARTTALLGPSVTLLETLRVWPDLSPAAAPLATMRIVDGTGRVPRAPEIAFDAPEVGLEAFGYNVPNDALNGALAIRLRQADVVRLVEPAVAVRLGPSVQVATPSATVEAALVVGADGIHSLVRREAGVGARRWSYDQSAFVTTLTHERAHGNASIEIHTRAGPFTLVPLPGRRSSLVWVSRPHEAERRAALDPGPLAREIEAQAHCVLGRMEVDGPRAVIAMEGMMADRFATDGVVLVGEAAHRLPPIGAQGLNLGLRDVATLRELLLAAQAGGTLAGVPAAFDRRRRFDVGSRTAAIDALNRALLSDALPLAVARTAVLTVARGLAPLRHTMVRFGLGG